MWRTLKMFKHAHLQTKCLIFMLGLYLLALVWTTVQVYARLAYRQSDFIPIIVNTPP